MNLRLPASTGRFGYLLPAVLCSAFAFAACGGDAGPELTGAAAEGKQVFDQLNCSACHAGIGPELEGAWGTTISLDDGSTVVFDADWVERSVREPDAQSRDGDWRRMPPFDERQLDDDSLAAIVAYLEAVGPAGTDTTP